MCYYRLYVFSACGHTAYSSSPLRQCRDSRARRLQLLTQSVLTYWDHCPVRDSHAFQTVKVERPCEICRTSRDALLQHLDTIHTIRVDDTGWKVSYAGPEAVWDKEKTGLILLEECEEARAGIGERPADARNTKEREKYKDRKKLQDGQEYEIDQR
ncbi:hypothetical protein B9Z65_5149 [Elsinoe australis]|uniref:Uncharacterized protein n=1 Tax=Elsinoe australis TaxID=40998 RepID=A0A2P7ZDB7_9PEZI|nr:hypothetical protein B9Z65_5149 [Elsinoe australis]